MEKQINIDLQLGVLPPCTQKVYSLLKERSFKINDLERKTTYTSRSIRSSLKILVNMDLIDKLYDFNDLRSFYYKAK
ncbi:MAG: hypothetical protein HeimC3_44120 [Candidatus Heimdallarchaeota archaeon LC_3]|nr:MAG: hypothetical protein HeimC3_44120 [Candidatus Heimdallarchaeota archaeon LC_3]